MIEGICRAVVKVLCSFLMVLLFSVSVNEGTADMVIAETPVITEVPRHIILLITFSIIGLVGIKRR